MIVVKVGKKYLETFCNNQLITNISIDLKNLQAQSKNRKKADMFDQHFLNFILHYK